MFPLSTNSHPILFGLTLVMVLVGGGNVLAQEQKITGFAVFNIDNIGENEIIRGAAVGVAIGNDAIGGAFINEATGEISGIAIGSTGEITVGQQLQPDVEAINLGTTQQNIGRTEIFLNPNNVLTENSSGTSIGYPVPW